MIIEKQYAIYTVVYKFMSIQYFAEANLEFVPWQGDL